MKVDTRHEQYEKSEPFWTQMRDSIVGEPAIKDGGKKYLPMPPGLGSGIEEAAYNNYKSRARYPEMVAPAIEGMVGLMTRKIREPSLPSALDYLKEEATPDGLSLDALRARVWHEVCSLGRYILFVDVPEKGGDPFIAAYPAEACINWRTDGDRVTMAVFHESVEEIDPNDPFVTHNVSQWRTATIEINENGQEVYAVRVWREKERYKEGEDKFEIISESYPLPVRGGDGINYVPAVFIGSRDLLPDPDAIPLLGVVNKSLHYYRQYADYAMQLFMCANGTTPWTAGAADNEKPDFIGPTTVWNFEAEGAKAGYMEISGTGLEAQKNELENIKSEIAHETVRVLGEKKAAEAAETLRLRFQSQTATLSSISNACMSGLRQALRICAEWKGANPDEVISDGNVEFISDELDAQVLTALYDGIERGMIPDDLLIEYTRRTEMHDMEPEDYRKWSAGMVSE